MEGDRGDGMGENEGSFEDVGREGRRARGHGTMVPWYHGTMVPWYHGTMEPWYHGTTDPSKDPSKPARSMATLRRLAWRDGGMGLGC